MTNKTNKIKVADIDRMINEEIAKIRKIDQIKARLAAVNEELAKLDEVEVGGTASGEEWYEKGTPVAKFEKKGTHLKEEDPMTDEFPSDDTVELDGDMDADLEGGLDAEMAPETFEAKMAAIGRELDMKLDGAVGAGMDDMEVTDDVTDEPAIELGDDAETEDAPAEDAAAEDAPEEEKEEDEIEIDEVAVDEAGEQHSVRGTALVNEGVDRLGKKANPLLSKELSRMARLSGI